MGLKWLLFVIDRLLLGYETHNQYKIISKPTSGHSHFLMIFLLSKSRFLCSLNGHIGSPSPLC